MPEFELMFEADDLDDTTVESIYAEYDALVTAHGDGTTLTVTTEGASAAAAAMRVVEDLERRFRVRIHRMVEDLVSTSDIAARCEATPQAVGQWIRGVRHREHPFPARFNRVLGGVWLWSDVDAWLRRVGKPHDPVEHPRRRDYDEVNGWLVHRGPIGHIERRPA